MAQTNFDLSNLAVQCMAPNNELLYDDKGKPSIMVKIPKMTYAQLGLGDSTDTFPAFIVDGVEKDYIWISKYQNIVQDGRAYSLPAQDPKTSINFDSAVAACKAKGNGWHLMTKVEWALLAWWCKRNGTMPYGNNNYGKDSRESNYKAIPTYSSGGQTNRVATGTGPLTWSHDKTLGGIWDLNGNVSEWVGGIRFVYGELQLLVNNNAADSSHSQAAASAEWKAVDATSGDFVTPDGSGTTSNTLKLSWGNSKWTWDTSAGTLTSTYQSCTFVNVAISGNVSAAAKEVLYAYALAPDDTTFDYEGDMFYANSGEAERAVYRGGNWGNGTAGGVFYFDAHNARSISYDFIGGRSAYVEIPEI